MTVFNVMYPADGSINAMCDPALCEYDFQYAVSAKTLEEAFKNGQHDFNPALEFVGCRSMCVGDIIMDENHVYHMVMGTGFKVIDETAIQFHSDEVSGHEQ
jgi:hypothetical protein